MSDDLILDKDRVRAMAARIEHDAEALRRFRDTSLGADDLPASRVIGVAGPGLTATMLDPVIAELLRWAAGVRATTDDLAAADLDAAPRLPGL